MTWYGDPAWLLLSPGRCGLTIICQHGMSWSLEGCCKEEHCPMDWIRVYGGNKQVQPSDLLEHWAVCTDCREHWRWNRAMKLRFGDETSMLVLQTLGTHSQVVFQKAKLVSNPMGSKKGMLFSSKARKHWVMFTAHLLQRLLKLHSVFFFGGSVCFVLLLVGNWMQFFVIFLSLWERITTLSGVSRLLYWFQIHLRSHLMSYLTPRPFMILLWTSYFTEAQPRVAVGWS